MRWERLFADLEAQLDAAEQAEFAAEVADRTRREAARIRLADRLRAARWQTVTAHVLGAGAVTGEILEVGPDWVLLTEPPAREALVPLGVLLGVTGLGVAAAAPGSEGLVAARLGLGAALRGVARDRSPVAVVLVDGSTLTGTVDRVGADFVEVAQHAAGEPRRRSRVAGVRAVPVPALAVLRREADGPVPW